MGSLWARHRHSVDHPPQCAEADFKDFFLSDAQMSLLESNLEKRDEKRGSKVSALLKTGLFAAQYSVGTGGALGYEIGSRSDLWELLDRSTQNDVSEHPKGHPRRRTPAATLCEG